MWLDLQVQRRLQAAGQDFVLDVSLQCSQRQVVLFGPSGAGKSTLIKLANGLLTPDAGEILIFGDFGGAQMAMVIDDRKLFCVLMEQRSCCFRSQQKFIIQKHLCVSSLLLLGEREQL